MYPSPDDDSVTKMRQLQGIYEKVSLTQPLPPPLKYFHFSRHSEEYFTFSSPASSGEKHWELGTAQIFKPSRRLKGKDRD